MEKKKLVLKMQVIATLSDKELKGINGGRNERISTDPDCPSEVCDTNVCTIQTLTGS